MQNKQIVSQDISCWEKKQTTYTEDVNYLEAMQGLLRIHEVWQTLTQDGKQLKGLSSLSFDITSRQWKFHHFFVWNHRNEKVAKL